VADVRVTQAVINFDERRGDYDIIWIDINVGQPNERRLQVSVSPTGKSVQVYVENEQVFCG
jgi:hypothetical protein